MTKDNTKDTELTLSKSTKLSLTKTVEGTSVHQSSHGRSKTIRVEVRRTRTFAPDKSGTLVEERGDGNAAQQAGLQDMGGLSSAEREARLKALATAKASDEKSILESQPIIRTPRKSDEEKRAKPKKEAAKVDVKPDISAVEAKLAATTKEGRGERGDRHERLVLPDAAPHGRKLTEEEEAAAAARNKVRRDESRRTRKLTLSSALGSEDGEMPRTRSMAAERRAREKARRAALGLSPNEPAEKKIREVIIPEVIQVQELANRMAVRGVDVVKELMKLGIMATVNQNVDADTAELLVGTFGHKTKRVTEADVENVIISGAADTEETLTARPPVVTIMGHVDHGKTSLLDAIRQEDVAAGEAGGITQHIGAYQIETKAGNKITFLDTPGHEAFTAMRSRGAKVTDIVVLVVAADDGIMPQTVEAINHAKAAQVPIIVAINKIDKPGADPRKVMEALLSHELVVEDMGGETICVEVSAKNKTNLDKLEEAILLQAEILELKANIQRKATGAVVESKIDKGRGIVATLLVQKGTLKVGDILVAGVGDGRVRALYNDKGQSIQSAGPSMPVEVLGLTQVPAAGDSFDVVDTEKQAREIAEYRIKREKDLRVVAEKVTLEQMFKAAGTTATKELTVIIKADVQGSAEAIVGSLLKLSTDEVKVKVIHSAVGGITESDVTLAQTVGAIIIGFNVRANVQAKEHASREKVEIRYYSIIYNLVDDVKKALSGLLEPESREEYLGTAVMQQVFKVTKVGKVAGCVVRQGVIKRGAGVRLIRDDVVIHEGKLKTLKRFKDDVSEVKEGFECGMAFENYDDIKEGDMVEAFEVVQHQRTL
jgi:translation initiation factor IF-2